MDKAYPLSTPTVAQSLDSKNDSFCPKENNEQIFGPKVPCLNTISGLRI